MNNNHSRWTGVLSLLAVSLLAACGGGGDGIDVPEPVSQVPASAAVSVLSYTDYVQTSLAPSETADPLGLDQFAQAPVSEEDDPVLLN